MNNVILRGRLTADVETHQFVKKAGGDMGTVVSFSLAVPDRTGKRDKNGNFGADFIRCAAFGKNAEVLEAFALKGTEILISSGKLTSGSYEKDGVKVFAVEVQVLQFEFLSGTKTQDKEEKTEKKTA